jgi:hypothetical protein
MMSLRWYQCTLIILFVLGSMVKLDAMKTKRAKDDKNIDAALKNMDEKRSIMYVGQLYNTLHDRFPMEGQSFSTVFNRYLEIVNDDCTTFYVYRYYRLHPDRATIKHRTWDEIRKARLDSALRWAEYELKFVVCRESAKELKRIYKLICFMIEDGRFSQGLVEALKCLAPQPHDSVFDLSHEEDEDIES